MVANLLYYDRKEDDELPRGAIEQDIEDSIISVDEIVALFEKELKSNI